ncbi:MAG: FecR domain-containing protein, partial [Verrucomicrobiales bacterium]|nr:FecR domain-containing protein [Verrucomicrobiales bacterium]
GEATVSEFPATKPAVSRGIRIGAAAALVLFLVAVVVFQKAPTFATITNRIGVGGLEAGAKLSGERFTLERGILEMETELGATVVIEAPASFQFESVGQLRLFHGRLAADVPEAAQGFSVLTATGSAIDLGTEFGVDTKPDGESEIHVFEGEVIAESNHGVRQSLQGGEAFSLNAANGFPGSIRSSAFVRPDELALFQINDAEGMRGQSDRLSAQLRSDPALIALLDFENDVELPPGKYHMMQGRWPGLRAPEFVGPGDHMKLDVGGDRDWKELTLAAWVRLDHLGSPYQSLLHTDGWSVGNPGQVHWMVTRNTTMRLALSANALATGSRERHGYPDSITPVLPAKGRWVHLATVYDSAQKSVKFYLNGRLDSESRQEIAHPARLGSAEIGNWDKQDRKLSGRIDELIILGRTMSDAELRNLYEVGNPYRKVDNS